MSLTQDELVALAASAREMMTADTTLTEGEFELVAGFAPQVGITDEQWRTAWDEAVQWNAAEVAANVHRKAAREVIYELLYVLAMDGGISEPEWDLLEWIDEVWR